MPTARKKTASKRGKKTVTRSVSTKTVFGIASKNKAYKKAKAAAKKAASRASKLYKDAVRKAKAAKKKARR